MVDQPSVLCEMEGSVAVVRLNRPGQLNALTEVMLDSLRETLSQAVIRGARCALLTGQGKAFCAGADLTSSVGSGDRDLGDLLRAHYNPLVETMANLPIPIVTAVNGAAAGAGASLALLGDLVLAARSSYFMLAFANIGLVPDAGATWLVARSAGRAKALEMALLGERLAAQDAYDARLVTRVFDDETLVGAAMELAQKLAAMPPMALGLTRKQVAAALSCTLSETLETEANHQGFVSTALDKSCIDRPSPFQNC